MQKQNLISNRSQPKNDLCNFPQIPDKLYFSIGEASDLCLVKPHVLRYWEQEFSQLNPVKRYGKRRYYQRNEILLIRRIKNLLYEQGFTIEGARNKLSDDNKQSVEITRTDLQVKTLIKNIISQLTEVLAELDGV
ncbi:MAG: MerR family transcriptional regulator [Coxiellaceae bacterium]|jgi:DNA-binding transcriptional MerR regulator|nr:MerR family transcriptional regulator [Coxiellaceae bacterium]